MDRNPDFPPDRTIKVSGTNKFLQDALTIHFQRKQNGGGDVTKVQLPFDGPDTALVEFDSSEIVESVLSYQENAKEAQGCLRVERWRKSEELFVTNQEDFVSFDSKFESNVCDRNRRKGRQRNPKMSKRPAVKSTIYRKKSTKSRHDFHKERREEQKLRNRKLTEDRDDEGTLADCPLEKDTQEVDRMTIFKHMGDDFQGVLIDKIKESDGSKQINHILRRKNLSLRERMRESYLSGVWYAVKNIFGLIYVYFMGKEDARRVNARRLLNEGSSKSYSGQQWSSWFPSGGPTSSDNCQDVIVAAPTEVIINEDKASEASINKDKQQENAKERKLFQEKYDVEPKVMRYIYSYHWAEFEKLKKVCKEIKFEITLGNKESLSVIAADHVDKKTFKETTDGFVSFYQTLYPNMYQEELLVKGSAHTSASSRQNDRISETGKRFPVIVSQSQDGNKCFIYGEKSQVKQAVQFLAKDSTTPKLDHSTNAKIRRQNLPLSLKISEKLKILIYQGDIVNEDSDAIVNPANENLNHKGGVALAIVNRGGKSIQDESDGIMNRRRRALQPGDVELTSSGHLPCKFIIHAVGPRWNGNEKQCRKSLYAACIKSLALASNNGAKSIAIPAISSGLFGVPKEICAEELYSAAENFSKTNTGPLREIRFVNVDEPTVQIFEREMKKRFHCYAKDQKGSTLLPSGVQKTAPKAPDTVEVADHQNSILTDKSNDYQHFQNEEIKPATSSEENGNGGNQTSEDEVQAQQQDRSSAMKQRNKVTTVQITRSSSTSSNNEDPSPQSEVSSEQSKSGDEKVDRTTDLECCICLENIKDPKVLSKCKHTFCKVCIDKAFEKRLVCPVCSTVYGEMTGNQPDGTMTFTKQGLSLPGYEGVGSIVIHYSFNSGIQGSSHPNPGQRYSGTSRAAFLPDNEEGNKVLGLLKRAFEQRLTFTIGTSVTTGLTNQITWNDIHHKTSSSGGQAKKHHIFQNCQVIKSVGNQNLQE